ncbi:MAG: ABC transporter permease [Rhodospirillales bacterium]|nr:ABC transporter permease [Rhodospirillales bacterium]
MASVASLPRARRRPRLRAADVPFIAFVLAVAGLIAFGAAVSPHDAVALDPLHALQPPSLAFPFGTDEFGRDVFSRVLSGARPTLLLALAAAAMGVMLGAVTGLVSGYLSGATDEVTMRAMDALMSFPGLVLAMLVVVMLGPGPINIIGAIALVFWPRSARLVRSMVVDLARREFVDAARSRGESPHFIIFRELLPNVLALVIVDFSLRVTAAILLAASLAYLGVGVAPPTPAWGLMVKDGQPLIEIAPWLVLFPCAAIACVSIGAVLVGERLRRVFALPGAEAGR